MWGSGFLASTVLSMALLAKAVQTLPLGTAYAIWTGIGAVGTVLIGIFVFKEPATPIRLTVKDGVIQKVEGGEEAAIYDKYLRDFDDPGMLKMAHIAYGFNPGAKLTGNIVEDERVWGSTEWGIGYVSNIDAPPCGQDAVSHTDGICLNSSVWLDGVQIMDEGKIVLPELAALLP